MRFPLQVSFACLRFAHGWASPEILADHRTNLEVHQKSLMIVLILGDEGVEELGTTRQGCSPTHCGGRFPVLVHPAYL